MEQFEILGLSSSAGYNKDIVGLSFLGEKDARPLINGKNTYARVFIKNKKLIKWIWKYLLDFVKNGK